MADSTDNNEEIDHSKLGDLDEKIKDASARSGLVTDEQATEIEARKKRLVKASHSAGLEFTAAIIFATLFGVWLDREFGTAPICMLVFMLLGAVVAFYNLMRLSENLNSSQNQSDSELPSSEKQGKKTPNK